MNTRYGDEEWNQDESTPCTQRTPAALDFSELTSTSSALTELEAGFLPPTAVGRL